jgi:hypothetical protein
VVTPPDAEELDAMEVAAATDAYVPDAWVPDRFHPPAPSFNPCKLPPSPDNPTCNPPAPTAMIGRVLRVRVEGKDLIIDVSGGTHDGVYKGWHAELVTDGGRIIPSEPIEILQLSKASTKLRIPGMNERELLERDPRVRLSPP